MAFSRVRTIAQKATAEGGKMLEVDLQAPDQEVGQLVSQTCARYGRVTSVKVHRTPSAFALVEMTNRDQTNELAANYGGSTFGNCALIHLHQKTA